MGVGVGPGDPELMTLKAMRALGEADVIAHFAKAGHASHARTIAARHVRADVIELPLLYPVTTELPKCSNGYRDAIGDFYDAAAAKIAAHLEAGCTSRRDLRRRPAVLRLLHASACAAGAALSDRDRRRRDRHVGMLVGGGNADRAGRRRLHRASRDLAGRRTGAPAGRRRRRRGDEGRTAFAEIAPRARKRAAACSAPSMSSAAPWPTRK